MKKIIAMLAALAMVLSMVACGSSSKYMSYDKYVAAAMDSEVEVQVYVQDHQSWWDNQITVYAADKDGAYLLYNMACSEEDAAKLVPGTEIIVKGYKSEWSGEVEIADATFTFGGKTNYVAKPVDLTTKMADAEKYMNQYFTVTGAVVEPIKDANGNEAAFLYNWDGSGEKGSDLYFNVNIGGKTYQFTVESYLRGADTDVYQAVEGLSVGDTIECTGFMYWYNGANPHITIVK